LYTKETVLCAAQVLRNTDTARKAI